MEGVKAGVGFGGMGGKEWVLEQLKKEASSLSRLRHPDILHMVEPLEESRSELIFITERVTSSLSSLAAAARSSTNYRSGRPPAAVETSTGGRGEGELDLDEVEIQKGTLQLARGLGFLYNQAKMVHLNLGLEAVVINIKVRHHLYLINWSKVVLIKECNTIGRLEVDRPFTYDSFDAV